MLPTSIKTKIRSSRCSTPVNRLQKFLRRESKVDHAYGYEQNNQNNREDKQTFFQASFGPVNIAASAKDRGQAGAPILQQNGDDQEDGDSYLAD
jgi:hypothetical protein